MKKKTRQILILNGLLILIVAAAILSVNSGYARIPFSTAVHSIFQPHMEGTSVVVAQFRVPRIVLAVLCGIGLALAGCVMQTVTGNPLADPGILGINAGAGFAVMLFLTFFPALHIRTMAYQPIFAIAGGLCTTGLLYLFAKRNGKLLPIYFLLGGIGLASLFSSFMLIMAANMDNSSYQLVARWLTGNIWGNELASGSCPVALYAHTGSFSSYKVEHTGYSALRREYGHFSGDSRREGDKTAPDCIGGSYLCLRCRQRRDRFCGTGSAAYGTKVDRRQTPRPYACLHAAGGAAVAFGRHVGTVCLSAEGDPGWYRDLRAFGSVFSVPAPQVFLREDVYAFTYAGKGFVCRI